jgi:tetratricopeptide (TPR) repeat protein
MIPCPSVEKWQEYVRDRLSPAEDRVLTEHVQGCNACEQTLARLVGTCRRPQTTPLPGPPADLVKQLRRLWAVEFPPEDPTAPESWPRIEGYEILGVLGRGGMGVVYRARDSALGREVAVKMIAAGEQSSAADVRRLLNDATTAAQLRHDGIVPVHAVGQCRGLPYCVMELIGGGSLAQRTADLVHEPREAARLIAAAARALHHAHRQGVCHRDVKPANILLRVRHAEQPQGAASRSGAPAGPHPRLCDLDACVTDFGLAKRTRGDASLTADGIIVGTPGYLAPEQIRAEKPAPAADIYGLGAVLYECLTGQPPCRAATPFDTLLLALHREPERPRAFNSRLHRDLETICLKCLEKEPQRRYASAAALADDLGRWLRGEPIRARPVSAAERVWRWCRRYPRVAGLTAALVVVVLGGFAGVLYEWRLAEAARREAEARDAQVRELLTALLQPDLVAPLRMHPCQELPDVGALRQAEERFAHLLDRRPGDTELRIALTNVRGNLGTLYALRGQVAEAEACFQRARELWQADSRNPQYRTWLATICVWQSEAAWRRDDLEWCLRLKQRAYALWQELADEQPGNREARQQAAILRVQLLSCLDMGRPRDELLRPLEEERALLRPLVAADPAGTALRKRLALACFLLGEFHRVGRRGDEAVPCWRQAGDHYRVLAREQPEDPLVQLNLALCCSRLVTGQPTDPNYTEAVTRFERAAHGLTALLQQDPDGNWLRHALLESYCSLAVCHWKAGRPSLAEQTLQQRLRPLVAQAGQHGSDLKGGLYGLNDLLVTADLLQAEQPAAALAVVRDAAALAGEFADNPTRDPPSCEWLAVHSVIISAFLCRLGDPKEALRQAEHARRLFEGLRGADPATHEYGQGLSQAWERIAKARWALGRRQEALDAFREAAEVQRQVVAQAPSVHLYRLNLGRCYDRLAYWGGLAGDRAEAAAALLEREKLWPEDPEQLLKVSQDFQTLAEAVGTARSRLSAGEQAERQRYLAEAERARLAAEAVRGAASRAPPPPKQGDEAK